MGSYRRNVPPVREGTVKVNKFPGACARCSADVAEGKGVVRRESGAWVLRHRDVEMAGWPVPMANYGCPGDAAAQNAEIIATRGANGLSRPSWADRFESVTA